MAVSRSDRKVIRRTIAGFPSPTPQSTPCRLWQGSSTGGGYGRKWVHAIQKHMLVHRWVWEQAHGTIPEGQCVLHRCDNRLCYRYDHLFLGTMKDNTADMTAKGRDRGRFRSGDDHPTQTLSGDDVRAIRAEWTGRYGQASELARRYGVHRTTILRIAKGEARVSL